MPRNPLPFVNNKLEFIIGIRDMAISNIHFTFSRYYMSYWLHKKSGALMRYMAAALKCFYPAFKL